MKINYNTTTCMTVGTKKRLNNPTLFNMKIDDVCIENVSKQKLLGVYIDKNLSWSLHIDHLCSVIYSKISLLKQLATYVPAEVQKGYILPLIGYGSNTWGTTSSANIERLTKLQKRANQIILKVNYATPSASMFQELECLPVSKRIKYKKAILTYKALNNLMPQYITDLLKSMSHIHSVNLRSSENGTLHVPRSRTKLYERSFSCSAPRVWNSLPHSVRNASSLNSFKTSLSVCF